MCIGGVNLQHFNRNHLVNSDYVQFNIKHQTLLITFTHPGM